MSKILRISDEAYTKLHQITKNTGLSNQEVIDKALQTLEREAIFKKANEAYAAIRNDPKQWQEEQEELALWDSTLGDGLEDE